MKQNRKFAEKFQKKYQNKKELLKSIELKGDFVDLTQLELNKFYSSTKFPVKPGNIITPTLPPAMGTKDRTFYLIMVPENLHVHIMQLLNSWIDLIRNKYNKHALVAITPHCEYTPAVVRNLMKACYDMYSIEGVILIGQWNIAHWRCTEPDGYIRSGPLWMYYTDLDIAFDRNLSDPALEGTDEWTFNRVDRFHIDYPHDNISWTTGEEFQYGSEIWCTAWRATGIRKPKEEDDAEKEAIQINRFLLKSMKFHNKNLPYFINNKFFAFKDHIGICHWDYQLQCEETQDDTTAKFLEELNPHQDWYEKIPNESSNFVKLYRQDEYKRMIFDIWTHANMHGFYPDNQCVRASDIYHNTHENAGFLITPIFGCSSGVFEMNENHPTPYLRYNYALSLLMSKGIDLFVIGTPWTIGFGRPQKYILYENIIENKMFIGNACIPCDTESTYLSWYHFKDTHHMRVHPYMFFGDPFLMFKKLVVGPFQKKIKRSK